MATIYYFSATGNSLDVAKEIAQKLGDAKLQSLVPHAFKETAANDDTVGLVFPVYDWSIPLVVRDFLNNLDVSGAKYIFAVATCNYMPGCALDRVQSILTEKGAQLNAGFIVRMPGTYLPMYGANKKPTQKHKFAHKSKKAEKIARIVKSRLNYKIEKSPILLDRLLGPRMEKHMDTFYEKDREFIVESGCSSCGICVKVCPFDNIVMKDNTPEWQHKCQQCFACIHLCAKNCIQIGNKTQGKTRYKNPSVSLNELIQSACAYKQTL